MKFTTVKFTGTETLVGLAQKLGGFFAQLQKRLNLDSLRVGNTTKLDHNGDITCADVTCEDVDADSVTTDALTMATGAVNGYVATCDGDGVVSWGATSSTVAGSDTQVQYNDDGSLAGAPYATYTKATGLTTLTALKVTTGAGANKLLAADADGDLTYTDSPTVVDLTVSNDLNVQNDLDVDGALNVDGSAVVDVDLAVGGDRVVTGEDKDSRMCFTSSIATAGSSADTWMTIDGFVCNTQHGHVMPWDGSLVGVGIRVDISACSIVPVYDIIELKVFCYAHDGTALWNAVVAQTLHTTGWKFLQYEWARGTYEFSGGAYLSTRIDVTPGGASPTYARPRATIEVQFDSTDSLR